MKLNRKTLRKMILNEIKNITESQKEVGLPHIYTDLELYHHALNFLQSNFFYEIKNYKYFHIH